MEDDYNEHLPTQGLGRDEMMQFYSWSDEDALKAQKEWEARYKREERQGRGPYMRWVWANRLKEIYHFYCAGDRGAILVALYICSLESLPIPRWCELAYLAAYRKVREYKAKSWDDVFLPPHTKGTHLATKKQEWEMSPEIFQRIEEIKKADPSIPIDGCLFEKVGREFGIGGKTLTEKLYYKWKNRPVRK
jgi:hypothetical protein